MAAYTQAVAGELTAKKSFRLIPGDYAVTTFTQKLLTREFTPGFGDMLGWWNFDDALGLEQTDEFFFCAQQASLTNAVIDATAAKYGSFGFNISTIDTSVHSVGWLFSTTYGQSKKQQFWLSGSVGLWVKCVTLPASTKYNKVFIFVSNIGNRIESRIDSNGAINLIYRASGTDQTISSANGVIVANTWHFVELRWNQPGSYRDIWVDGVRVAISNSAFNLATPTIVGFYVGQHNIIVVNSPYYIDYVRLSNTLRRLYPYKDLAAWPGLRPSQEIKWYTYKKLITRKTASQTLSSTAVPLKVVLIHLSASLNLSSDLPKKTTPYPNSNADLNFFDGTPLELSNGGFEIGDFTDWTYQSPQGITVQPRDIFNPYRGFYCAELHSWRQGAPNNKAAFIGRAVSGLTPGDKYCLSFGYSFDGGVVNSLIVYLKDTDETGTVLWSSLSLDPTSGWIKYISEDITVPASGIIFIQFQNNIPALNGDNYYYIDNARLIKRDSSPSILTERKIKYSIKAGVLSYSGVLQGVFGRYKHLDSVISFNSSGYRIRDGVIQPSYSEEDACVPITLNLETCDPITLISQTCDPITLTQEACVPEIYYDNQDPGLIIYNQDGCQITRQRQVYSYAPPARSNMLSFNGNLLKNSLSLSTRFLADLQFNAVLYKKSAEAMTSSLSFSGIKHDKPKRVYPAGASFGGSLTGVKTSIGIQNAWAWWKADDISDDTDSPNIDVQGHDYNMPVDSIWRDRSGNGRHLFFKPQGVGNIKYKTNQANGKPCVWWSGSVAWAAFATNHTLSGDFYIVYAFKYSTGVISNGGFDVLLSANDPSVFYIRMPYGSTTQYPTSVENEWLWRNGAGDTEIRIPSINGESLKSVTTFHTHAIQRVGNSFTVFFDNVSRGSVSGSTGAYLTGGIRTYFTPVRNVNETFMLEGVIYNRIPDSTEKANVQSYLANKWGI